MAKVITRQVYIPCNLNVEALVADYPPTEVSRFNKEHLRYIIGLVTSIPATNKDIATPDGFVPIHARTLRNRIKQYRQYLDYLLRTGILETDNQYIKAEKSKGYRFCAQYATAPVATSVIRLRGTKAWTSGEHPLTLEDRKTYKHLLPQYHELHMDEQAYEFVEQDKNRKEANPMLRDKIAAHFVYKRLPGMDGKLRNVRVSVPEGYKNPVTQYSCSLINIDRIREKDFRLNIDTNVHRLHSTISNMWSAVRNFITYQGHTLVSIDVKNSQPYISTALLDRAFWGSKSYFNKYKPINNLKRNIKPYVMVGKVEKLQASPEFQRFISLVSSGTFYDEFALMVQQSGAGSKQMSKKELKEIIFTVLFTDNRFIYQKEAEPKRIFQKMFPLVYEIFEEIKRNDKTLLPRLLQCMESRLMLMVITKRIARERPGLPVFTIHDSIVTTEGNEGYIQQVMTEELTTAIGVSPALSIEVWKPENTVFNDGTPFLRRGANIA